MTARAMAFVISAAVLSAIPARGQADSCEWTPLPSSIQDSSGSSIGGWPGVTEIETDHGPVSLNVGFRKRSVRLDWSVGLPDSESAQRTTWQDVQYRITDVTVRARETDTIYVVGWNEADATVLAEEWFLGAPKLEPSKMVSTSNAPYRTAPNVIAPAPARRTLFSCSHVPPVSSAAVSAETNQLWMISKGRFGEQRLWALPIEAKMIACERVHAAYEEGPPSSGGVRTPDLPMNAFGMVNAYLHPELGLMLALDPRDSYSCLIWDDRTYYLLWDRDLDGKVDSFEVTNEGEFRLRFTESVAPEWAAAMKALAEKGDPRVR